MQTLPLETFVCRDRQSDMNAWNFVSPTVQKSLKLQESVTIQRYPELYRSHKVSKKSALIEMKVEDQVYIASTLNGDVVLYNGSSHKLYIIGHQAVAMVCEVAMATTGTTSTVYKDRLIGCLQLKELGKRIGLSHPALYNQLSGVLTIMKPLPKKYKHEIQKLKIAGTVDLSTLLTHLACASRFVWWFSKTDEVLYKTSLRYVSKKTDKSRNYAVEVENKTSVLNVTRNEILFLDVISLNDTESIVTVACINRIFIIKNDSAVREITFTFPRTCAQFCTRLVTDRYMEINIISEQNHLLPYIFDMNDQSFTASNPHTLLATENHVKNVCSYLGQLIILAENNEQLTIFLDTKLSEAAEFCYFVHQIYNTAGLIPSSLLTRPSTELSAEEKGIVRCRGISLNMAVSELKKCVTYLNNMLNLRQKILGIESVDGPGGFISLRTMKSLNNNLRTLTRIAIMIDLEKSSRRLINEECVRVYAILNESDIEHMFGKNYQSLTSEHAEMHEYLYAKRKIEMLKILKMCQTPFHFVSRKKDYADPIQSESKVGVMKVLGLIHELQPKETIRTKQEPKSKADKAVVKLARTLTHGMRSKSNRSVHKPSAFYPPTGINFEVVRTENLELMETDEELDIDGLHTSFAVLKNGIQVQRDEWVLFKFSDKYLIGLYQKSLGHESIIDSTGVIGNGLYGWPCRCNAFYNPLGPCGNESCRDVSYIPTSDILCNFTCPVLTRAGFRIPSSITQKYIH